jgi:hypothetical protein
MSCPRVWSLRGQDRLSTQRWKRTRTLPDVINGLEVIYRATDEGFDTANRDHHAGTFEWRGPIDSSDEGQRRRTAFVAATARDGIRMLADDGLRVITVEPEQVGALPDLGVIYAATDEQPESLQAGQLATIARAIPLPFDPLYIDIGADGQQGFPLTERGPGR